MQTRNVKIQYNTEMLLYSASSQILAYSYFGQVVCLNVSVMYHGSGGKIEGLENM